MEELNYQAIVLIYPDGFVEKIPITDLKFHWEYLKEHIKHSKRFASINGDLINDINHFPLDKGLAANGICVLYNWNIREIVEDKTFLNTFHAHFLYYLPSAFQSLKQLLEFLILIRSIDFKYVCLKLFDEQNNKLSFKNLNEQSFFEFVLENKKRLLEKIALLLIYPDGEAEEILRNELEYHMEHFKEQIKISKRFKEYMENRIKTCRNHEHYKAINELTSKGMVEIANMVEDLTVQSLEERKGESELDFQVSLPNRMGSRKQTVILETLLARLDEQNFQFGKYPFNQVEGISRDDYEKYIEENKFLFTNNNIRSQAIILIYPDGEVERILINAEISHTEYLKRHLQNSRRFYELVKNQNLNFDWGIHFHIDQVLLFSGVIVLYNYNVKDIVNDLSFIYNYPVFFDTHLCSEFFSERQKDEFMNIYERYKDLLILNIFNREQGSYLNEEEKESFKL